MAKKKLIKQLVCIVLCILLLLLLIPNVIYIIHANRKPADYTTIDYSVDGPEYIINDATYEETMKNVAEPFIKEHETSGYIETEPGINIFYRTYLLSDHIGNVVISHGFCENSEKYAEQIYYFLKEGYQVFIMDHRGHGYSTREVDNSSKVWVSNFNDYVEDFSTFVEKVVKSEIKDEACILYAHSMGGGIGVSVIEKHPEYFYKVILSCPMLDPKCSVLPRPLAKFLANAFCLFGNSKSYVVGNYDFDYIEDFSLAASGSVERYHYYFSKCMNDTNYQSYGATYGWLKSAVYGAEELMKDKNLEKINIPILVFMAENDNYVTPQGIYDFCDKVPTATLIYVPESKHEVYTRNAETQNAYRYLINEFLAK